MLNSSATPQESPSANPQLQSVISQPSQNDSGEVESVERKRHKLAHPNGGLCMNDEDGSTRPGFINMMGKLVKKLITMQFYDILKNPPPTLTYYPRTYLENSCIDLSFSSQFMTKAALTRDPIERLKYVVCMYVSGQHINPS